MGMISAAMGKIPDWAAATPWGSMAEALIGKQLQRGKAPAAAPQEDPLPPWFTNPSGPGPMPQPGGGAQTPPFNPMGGPGGQMPMQWGGVMPSMTQNFGVPPRIFGGR